MSQRTDNYGLILENDPNTKFKEWREAINGTVSSNFIEVDRILGEKGNKSVSVDGVLKANAWVGLKSPFIQELAVEGLSAAQNGDIAVAHSANYEQREIAREALLCITGQENGKLIVSADGELPDRDIPVVITLLG